MTITTITVPAAFATELLADWREPADDDERATITDPEQLAYESKIDAHLDRWLTQLVGDDDRTLTVPPGPAADWFHDELAGSVLEGLTSRLADGSTEERERVVEALDGWTATMAQLEG